MKHNLLEIFDNKVKPILFEELKRENPSINKVIYQHLTIIHASILGGLIEKSKKPNGAKAIKTLIEKGNHTGDIIARIPGIFGDNQKLSDTKKLGNSLLAFVFDDGTDKAFEKIQHFLSEKYLSNEEDLIEVNRMIAPFSMGLIGQTVHEEEMSEQQVADLLAENEPFISMRFPGLAKVLGIRAATVQPSTQGSTVSTVPRSEADLSETSEGQEKVPSAEDTETESEDKHRTLFIKSLWPWVVLLLISGLSLFLLEKYQGKSPHIGTRHGNPFNFIQSDSLILGDQKSYILPGNILLEVDRNSTLDSLLIQLESNEGIIDTLRYLNPKIIFQDSTAILTSSANKELGNIISILQSYPELRMVINIYYDKTNLAQYPDITNQQIKNLRDYFTVFGLDGSRFKINKSTYQAREIRMGSGEIDPLSETTKSTIPPELKKKKSVELLFFHNKPATADSLNIQNN